LTRKIINDNIDTNGRYGGGCCMARNKYPEETVNLILEEALKLFIEKGYEHTSIQDIINNLGGLSKGAIYHHFKSKEEIFQSVCEKIGNENTAYFNKLRDDKTMTGYEKLKMMIKAGYANPGSNAIIAMSNKIMNDPKFVMKQVIEIYELIVPCYIEPIINEGISDGSIETAYPKELAEVIITLMNIWVNPAIAKSTPEEMRRKMEFFSVLLNGIGIDILDTETILQYVEYSSRYNG